LETVSPNARVIGPRLQLVVTAVLFSTGGAAIKAVHFSGWQIAACRALVTLASLLVMIPEARHWSRRTMLVGITYGATTLQYVLANKLTTAANTVFIQNTYPLFIALAAPWVLREHVTRRDLVQLAAMLLGLALFFVGTEARYATAPHPLLGNVLAAGSALAWGTTVIGYRWLSRDDPTQGGRIAAAAASGNLFACLIALPFALPLQPGTPADWAIVGYLGVFQLGLAYVFLTRAIPRVRALEASLFLMVEPVLNPVWAWLVHGERPSGWAVAGGAVILAATAGKALAAARR
jgi:drug/metabolite transporter, DME family